MLPGAMRGLKRRHLLLDWMYDTIVNCRISPCSGSRCHRSAPPLPRFLRRCAAIRCFAHSPKPTLPHFPPPQFYCSHLTAAAGWCIFSGLCPQEGERAWAQTQPEAWTDKHCRRLAPTELAPPAVRSAPHPPPQPPNRAVRAIEDCIGISSSAGRSPAIPKSCQDRAALLEACIESKQALAEARTTRCSGPQPIDAPVSAAAAAAGGEGVGAEAKPKAKRGRKPKSATAAAAAEPAAGTDQAPSQ